MSVMPTLYYTPWFSPCVPMSMPNSLDTARPPHTHPQQQADPEALGRPSRLPRPTSDTLISQALSLTIISPSCGFAAVFSGSIKRTLLLHYSSKDTLAYTDDSTVRKMGFVLA